MFWFGLLGIAALFLGLLYFISPDYVCKINSLGNKAIGSMDGLTKKHPKILGIFYLICAAVLIYFGFFSPFSS